MPSLSNKQGNHQGSDFLEQDIACLNPDNLHATLVSSLGSHCEVWRSNFKPLHDSRTEGFPYVEFVIKYPRKGLSRAEIGILGRHYQLLKKQLDDIVPNALFCLTRINGEDNICVLAEAVNIWFDLVHPHNRQEAIELLRKHPKPRIQLQRFLEVANSWREEGRLIDLYGPNNLILDTDRQVRYLDSYFVFFFEDMLSWDDDPDSQLAFQIEYSLHRLAYLNTLLTATQIDNNMEPQ
jgi:hypothetical protein